MDLLIEVSKEPVVEALLLLLLLPIKGVEKIDWSNELIKSYEDKVLRLKHQAEAIEFLSIILNDNFRKDIVEDQNLYHLHLKLKKVKKQLLETYFSSIKETSDSLNEYEFVGDFNSLISIYYLQMKRLQMVIQPEIQLNTSKHPVTKKNYLKSVGFWVNDRGERERKYFKSIGRVDEFPQGKKDPSAYRLAENMIREMIKSDYFKTYPD